MRTRELIHIVATEFYFKLLIIIFFFRFSEHLCCFLRHFFLMIVNECFRCDFL